MIRKAINILIIAFEVVILAFFTNIVYNDWEKNPVTKDYFSLVIIGEIGLELYVRLRDKTKINVQQTITRSIDSIN